MSLRLDPNHIRECDLCISWPFTQVHNSKRLKNVQSWVSLQNKLTMNVNSRVSICQEALYMAEKFSIPIKQLISRLYELEKRIKVIYTLRITNQVRVTMVDGKCHCTEFPRIPLLDKPNVHFQRSQKVYYCHRLNKK